MGANITFNPYIQTNVSGSFVIESDGYIVGMAEPDAATRNFLSGGILASTETLPMWGGVAISEAIRVATPGQPRFELGGTIARATATANLTGFSVFDQNYAAINFPQSPVPQIPSTGMVNFYRVGSGARLALEIDPALASMGGSLINSAVGWDFTLQRIIAGSGFPGKILGIKVGNSMAPVYNSSSGFLDWNRSAAAALVLI
jgi:hypothetical protein